MATQMSQDDKGQGNTKTCRIRARRWCFTLNNYTDESIDVLKRAFLSSTGYVIGKEIGTNQTPHLQGYVEYKNAKEFNALKKIDNKIHWEKAVADREDNIAYCTKDGDYIITFEQDFKEKVRDLILKEYEDVKWHPWQETVLNIIDGEPDPRKIYWIWEMVGNRGKSYLAKYIDLKYDAIIADGKKDNVFNQIKIHMDEEKLPKIIILDVPRHNLKYVNYGVLEQIKNGHIYSGKYEGSKCLFPHPHVIIFANEAPNWNCMSSDRIQDFNLNDPSNASTFPDIDYN